jgi:hypothetical protein
MTTKSEMASAPINARHQLGLPAPRPLLIGGGMFLLVIVGIGASAHPTGAPLTTHLTSLAGVGDAIGATALLVALGVFGLFAAALRPRRRHKSPDDYQLEPVEVEDMLSWWEKFLDWAKLFVVATGVILGLFWVIDRITTTSSPGSVALSPRTGLSSTTVAVSPGSGSTGTSGLAIGAWQPIAIVVVSALTLLAFVALIGRLRRPHIPFKNTAARLDTQLARLIDDALGELRNERDARRAVIHAYAAMERLFARRGRARRANETPFEYVEWSLEQAGAPRGAAIGLTDLFEQARFSEHVINETLRDDAIAALESVQRNGGVIA